MENMAKVTECKVFEYQPKHSGLNIALLPQSLLDKLRQLCDTDPVFVEITSVPNGTIAYGYAWYEENEHLENPSTDQCAIGLEPTLMDTCLVSPGDVVQLRALRTDEIQNAVSLEVQLLGENKDKIQTEEDLECVKNRILGGDVILAKDSRFIVPTRIAQVTHQLLFRVLEVEPSDIPVRCYDKTIIQFRDISIKAKKSTVSFADVGGLKKQIGLLREVIQLPMEYPEVFVKLGISPPRGILLYGPPGNGKTLLARSLANEIKASFHTINGPELMSKFAGEGERKLRQVFEKARQNAPSIIFFDEIDSFAGKRDSFTAEFEVRLVGQLLSMMDGLADRGNVVIIAATNRPNSIDPALRRPGRFDREIEVSLPSESDRLEILQKYVRGMDLNPDINLQSWAKKTSGYVGADLAALAREAAIRCLRRVFELAPTGNYAQIGEVCITNQDFSEAFKELQPTTLRGLPSQSDPKSWDELLGLTSIKNRLLTLIEPPINTPEQLKEIGLTPPTGVLLAGSPQSGKKSLALALAAKLNIQCISVKGLDFIHPDPNNSLPTLGEIFRKARLSAPAIILLDKIDLVFSTQFRETRESFLFAEDLVDEIRRNRLYENVFVIATARTVEGLPQILLDPSVFGHVLYIPIPSQEDYEVIIRSKLGNSFRSDIEYKDLVKAVKGLNSGEVIYVCEECLRMSLRNGTASLDDFKKAAQIVTESKTKICSP
ncbi:AAA family ATPase [Roseofilum sp. BLCC_M154]|uniref:AAA family ATPase n=1 Tax=Roseofilum acuticapitatum BLCC-M154 TaxID=3022444 RepID=A0ABT7AT31_9CYAN|nr:AAA family ATPase [Roseofilum acuticapitatum]MDJ1170068.1 AAA family ATPase [Roseofilum acuticapitatum BLCC-M154]